jgi:hypothetical protein
VVDAERRADEPLLGVHRPHHRIDEAIKACPDVGGLRIDNQRFDLAPHVLRLELDAERFLCGEIAIRSGPRDARGIRGLLYRGLREAPGRRHDQRARSQLLRLSAR